jgi:hypothetical protein
MKGHALAGHARPDLREIVGSQEAVAALVRAIRLDARKALADHSAHLDRARQASPCHVRCDVGSISRRPEWALRRTRRDHGYPRAWQRESRMVG